jgi:uncharacterized cupin superfamily protein
MLIGTDSARIRHGSGIAWRRSDNGARLYAEVSHETARIPPMHSEFRPDTVVDARALPLDDLPIDPHDVVQGEPRARLAELLDTPELTVGVWELSPGAVTDTEADEVFVVVSGSATVEFVDSGRILHLAPGSIGRLAAGSRTRWTVSETLRKVYVTLPEPAAANPEGRA